MKGFRSFSPLRVFCTQTVSACDLKRLFLSPACRSVYPYGASRSYFSSLAETVSEYERDQTLDEGKLTKKNVALHLALSQLAADFDDDSKLSLGRFYCPRPAQVISTGSLKLDQALWTGGLPKGRMVEIYGKESSGKTTLALHIVREAQKVGGISYCAYIDAENALNASLVEAMGINTNDLLIAHPNSAENTLSIVDILTNSGSVDVIVVDSVAALVPQCELDGTSSFYMLPRLMTQALRKIHYSLMRSQSLIIFVNQVRMHPRGSPGNGQMDEVTCGGNALKFYSAIRMRLSRNYLMHNENEFTGVSILVEVVKNNLAPANKRAALDIEFGRGFYLEAEVLELATLHGIILREGTGYWIKGHFLVDKSAAQQYLRENSEVCQELADILRNQLFCAAS